MNITNLERSSRIRLGMTGSVIEVRLDPIADLYLILTDASEAFVAKLNQRSEPTKLFSRMPADEFPIQVWKTGMVQKGFQWKDRHDSYHLVSNMETRHLFFTVRMIWNHCAPTELQLLPFKEYYFGPFYTIEYMKKAVEAIVAELDTRNDLQPNWKMEMDKMKAHFKTAFKEIDYESTIKEG